MLMARCGRVVLLAAWLALQAGCGVKLVYEQADRLVMWRVADYVTLDAAQKDALRSGVDGFLAWHRGNELERYADDLDVMVTMFADGPDREEWFDLQARAEQHSARALARIAPLFADVMTGLDPAQVDELAVGLQRANREILEDARLDESPERRHKRAVGEVVDFVEQFFGRLDPAQRALAAEQVVVDGFEQAWVRYRERWQAELLRVLRAPPGPTRRAQLEQLAVRYEDWHTPEYRAALDRRRESAAALLMALWPTLSVQQRDRFVDRIGALAGDFRELAAG